MVMLAFVLLQYWLFCRLVERERVNVWVTVLFRFCNINLNILDAFRIFSPDLHLNKCLNYKQCESLNVCIHFKKCMCHILSQRCTSAI